MSLFKIWPIFFFLGGGGVYSHLMDEVAIQNIPDILGGGESSAEGGPDASVVTGPGNLLQGPESTPHAIRLS
jgi:hypothetical protein